MQLIPKLEKFVFSSFILNLFCFVTKELHLAALSVVQVLLSVVYELFVSSLELSGTIICFWDLAGFLQVVWEYNLAFP